MNNSILRDTIINDSIVIKDTIYKFQHAIDLSNSPDYSQLWTNSITIFLGLLAALIALYQIKSNVISSARIKWIQNLTDAISDYSAEISKASTIISNMSIRILESNEDGKKINQIMDLYDSYYDDYFKSSIEIEKISNRIILHLNSEEGNHKKIENLLLKLSKEIHIKDFTKLNSEEIEKDLKEVIILSKLIFKEEWEKSKKIFKI